jgi:hypothetical protein
VAGVVVWTNTWAAELAGGVDECGARVLAAGWVDDTNALPPVMGAGGSTREQVTGC